MAKAPLIFTYYIAAPVENVWDGFVSEEANQKIFMGVDFELDLKPGGAMIWSGARKDGERVRNVTGGDVGPEPPEQVDDKIGTSVGSVRCGEKGCGVTRR